MLKKKKKNTQSETVSTSENRKKMYMMNVGFPIVN